MGPVGDFFECMFLAATGQVIYPLKKDECESPLQKKRTTWTLLTGCQIDGSWGATKQPLRVFAHHPDWRVLVYIYIYSILDQYIGFVYIYIYIGAG